MRKSVILDRDGVINFESKTYVKSPEEWIPIPGSLKAISQLNKAGFLVFIATNQSGVGRGLFSLATLELTHQKLISSLMEYNGHIDGIYFCPHTPQDNCRCRKPLPGMLENIRHDFKIDLKETFVVGDSFRDIQAGLATGSKTLLVKTGNGLLTIEEHSNELGDTFILPDLLSAVDYILEHS